DVPRSLNRPRPRRVALRVRVERHDDHAGRRLPHVDEATARAIFLVHGHGRRVYAQLGAMTATTIRHVEQALWTWSGTYVGYRVDDELWTWDGRLIGKFHGDEV